MTTDAYGKPVEAETTASQDVVGDIEPRCYGTVNGRKCNKLLARLVTRPWRIDCRYCKTSNFQK